MEICWHRVFNAACVITWLYNNYYMSPSGCSMTWPTHPSTASGWSTPHTWANSGISEQPHPHHHVTTTGHGTKTQGSFGTMRAWKPQNNNCKKTQSREHLINKIQYYLHSKSIYKNVTLFISLILKAFLNRITRIKRNVIKPLIFMFTSYQIKFIYS